MRAKKALLDEKKSRAAAPFDADGPTSSSYGLLKAKMAQLKSATEKPVPKSVVLEQLNSAGSVKSRVAAALKTNPNPNPVSDRKLAPMRTSVRARAAALSANSSISDQYANAYGGKFTPVPRRKHSVKAIVSSINENKLPIQDSPSTKSFDFKAAKKVFNSFNLSVLIPHKLTL